MKRLLFLLLFIPSLSSAQMTAEKTFIGNVPAVVYTPAGFDPAKKYPVVLFLHGKGEMGNGTEADLTAKILNSSNQAELIKRASNYQWIVIAPQLVAAFNGWVPGWTNSYLQPVYDYILKNRNTDLNQIYVTGLSLGGGGTWVACTGPFAQYIAAAVPICGTPQYTQDFSLIAKHNIPVWAFHAKDDNVVGYVATVNQVNSVNKHNPDPEAKMTVYGTGGHWIWGWVYSDDAVYAWLSEQRNIKVEVLEPEPPAKKIIATYKIVVYDDGSTEVIKQ